MMNRYWCLVGAFVLACSFSEPVCGADRPHIVMAFADDWGQYASAYGKLEPGGINDHFSTPNFDSVADEGVLFTRAFVSAPSCTPCRSSLLSGQHFWRCNRASILQGAIWDMSIPSYPIELQSNGYRIGHTYKVWSPGKPANAPHGGAACSFNKNGSKFNRFSQFVMEKKDRDAAKEILLNEVRANVRSFLDADDDQTVDGDEPICYWFGPTNVHRKWIAGSGKELWGVDPDDLKGKLPPYLPDVHTVREDFADYLGEVAAFDAGLGVIIEELKRVGIYDDTILVVSGDHGMPGVPRGKCNLYDFGTKVPLAIRWPKGIRNPGRVVDDFVSLPDLAPTFLEIADVDVPETMIARSLLPVLESKKSGLVDPSRDAVFTGRERHVAAARTDNKPYPQRAIRTDQYLYIINFEPERWPMGTGPGFGSPPSKFPGEELLRENTFAAFGDLDASPTKAWVVLHRRETPELFQFAVGQRPRLELYDVRTDPHCMINLAKSIEHAEELKSLHRRLMDELSSTGDPRVSADIIFERSPFTDAFSKNNARRK
jgi:arylsulfatase A-like enzyme